MRGASQRMACSQLERIVPRIDAWRQAIPGALTRHADYKEWVHFCVPLPGSPLGYLVLNASLSETRCGDLAERESRFVTLAHDGAWSGALESGRCVATRAAAGGIDLEFGASRIRWSDGRYRLHIENPALRADLEMVPIAYPSLTSSIALGGSGELHWLALPRLKTSGTVDLGRRRTWLQAVPTYHDHNWGRFRWGAELAWEWGVVQLGDASDPWTIVVARVSDGMGHKTFAQSVLVWRGPDLQRTFQNHEIRIRTLGRLSAREPLTLPRAARFVLPEVAIGVPARFVLEARGGADALEFVFDAGSAARIAVPSETDDLGLVVLHETCGVAWVRGSFGSRLIEASGSAIMEFVHG